MAEFKKGDTVRLKSGGPLMTVSDLGDYGPLGPENGVKCTWFEGNTRHTEVFDREVLQPSEAAASVRTISRG